MSAKGCPTCGGERVVIVSKVGIKTGVPELDFEMETCPSCNGRGYISDHAKPYQDFLD